MSMMTKRPRNTDSVREYVDKKIAIVEEFAKKMGYDYYIEEYNAMVFDGWSRNGLKDGELCKAIQLEDGPMDGDGNYYEWAWSLETGKEIKEVSLP